MTQQDGFLPAGALSPERKAELFDDLLNHVHDLMPDESWYDIFREIGMSDDEMRSAGLDLPISKVMEHTIRDMSYHIEDEIKSMEIEGRQLSTIVYSVDELAARFGVDMNSYQYAEDDLFYELESREGISDVELRDGKLFVTPRIAPMERRIEPEPPGLTMG